MSSSSATSAGRPTSSAFAAARLTATVKCRVLEPPLGALSQRGVEDPAGELRDRAGPLGERHELVGLQQPVLGVLPAHERLGAGDVVPLERHLRLVVQDELVALDRAPQLAEEAQPGRRVRVALGRVGLDAALAALGVVHRDVGALHQRRHVGAVLGRERHAHAGVELDGDPAQGERQAQGLLRSRPAVSAAWRGGAGGSVRTTANSSPPRRASVSPWAQARRSQGARPRPRQLVAVVVPERVVDLLEAVEIDEQHRHRVLPAGRP